MAQGSTYPAQVQDDNGEVRLDGNLVFLDSTNQPAPSSNSIVSGTAVAVSGLTGSVVATRYVGGTADVAPTTGAHLLGDWVVSSTGRMWVCTVAGTPGTWVEPASVTYAPLASPTFTGSPAAPSLTVSGLTGSIVSSRYVGQTATGAPASGAHLLGDFITTTDGHVFVCSVAGTPGTWLDLTALAQFPKGLAGQVLQGTGPTYAYPPGFEIAYDQITSGVNVASTSEGAPTAIIAGTSHTYEAVPYVAEFFSPSVTDPSSAAGIVTMLFIADGASIGRIAVSESITVSTQTLNPTVGKFRFTPTAAAHTYGISAFCSATTGTPAVGAGAGGINTPVPAYLRITKA